jgi:uncharacterized LabA/DUF88 family protein
MQHPDQRVGIFIDTQNMYYSARYLFKRKVDFKHIVEDATGGRRLIRAMAYVIRTKGEEGRPFFDALEKAGIELREKDLIEYASGHKKGDWDVGLTIDVVRMLDMLDVVFLVSGDGDYAPLVQFCQARGRIVELISFGETTSSILTEAVDAHRDMSQNKKRYLIGPALKPAYEKKSSHDAKPTYNDEPEYLAPPDSNDIDEEHEVEQETQGFFMPSSAKEDQEDVRGRRLEF